MMGLSVRDVDRLSWRQYQALLWHWNDRHQPDEPEAVEAPDMDFVAKRQQRLVDRGLAKVLH